MVHGEEEVDDPATQADVLLIVSVLRVVVWEKVVNGNNITPISKMIVRRVDVKLGAWSMTKCKREMLSTTVLLSD